MNNHNSNGNLDPTHELMTMLLKEHYANNQINTITDVILQYNSQLTLSQIKGKVELNPSYIDEVIFLLQNSGFVSLNDNNKYTLETKNVLGMLNYPQLVYIINNQFGPIGVQIIERLMENGVTSAKKLIENKVNEEYTQVDIKDILISLIKNQWLVQCEKSKLKALNNKLNGSKKLMIIEEDPLIYNTSNGRYYKFYLNSKHIYHYLNKEIVKEFINSHHIPIVKEVALYLLLSANSQSTISQILSQINYTTENDLKSALINSSNTLFTFNPPIRDKEIRLTDIVSLNKQYICDQIQIKAIETILSEQFSPNHVRVYRIISLQQHQSWKQILNYSMLTPQVQKQVIRDLHSEGFIEIVNDVSFGEDSFSINLNSHLIQQCINKVYKAIKELKLFFNNELSIIETNTTPLMQEQYMYHTYSEINKLNTLVTSLQLTQDAF